MNFDFKKIGALIRTKRLEKNYSQQGLCSGICTVSYLSKIEQGQGNPSEEIILALLKQLEIESYFNQDFLQKADKEISGIYKQIFEQGIAEQQEYPFEWIEENFDSLLHSIYFLDTMIFMQMKKRSQNLEALESNFALMDYRQKALFFLLKGEEEKAIQHFPCGYTYFVAGSMQCLRGEYAKAIGNLEVGFTYSWKECAVLLMMKVKLFLGNCYSELNEYQKMIECYENAEKILQYCNYTFKEKYIDSIYYNMGSTFLQQGLLEKAVETLQKCLIQDVNFCHKMGICMEKLGKKEQAKNWIEKGLKQLELSTTTEKVYHLRLRLVQFRLQNDKYLEDKQYQKLLTDCLEELEHYPQGWKRFEIPWLIELLTHQRKYKEIAKILQEFSWVSVKI